ncbi:MAG: hypothetical protein ACI9OH_002074 [Oleispira sp.]|jgi:hypothetical protein
MRKLYLIYKGILVLNNLVFRALGVICICFSISACSTSGSLALRTVSPTTIGNILKPGVSTKEHIISVLGSPNNVGLTQSGLEILTYEYKRNIPSFWNFTPLVLFSFQSRVHVKQLVILLNEDKTVKQTATNDTMLHSSFGIDE